MPLHTHTHTHTEDRVGEFGTGNFTTKIADEKRKRNGGGTGRSMKRKKRDYSMNNK